METKQRMRDVVVDALKAFITEYKRAPSCVRLSSKAMADLNEELDWDKRELLRIAKINTISFSEGEKIDFPASVERGTMLFGAIVLEAKDENTSVVFTR